MPNFEKPPQPKAESEKPESEQVKEKKYKSGRYMGVKKGPEGKDDYSQAVELIVSAEDYVKMGWQESRNESLNGKGSYVDFSWDEYEDYAEVARDSKKKCEEYVNKYTDHLISSLENFGKNKDNDQDVLSQLASRASIPEATLQEYSSQMDSKELEKYKTDREAYSELFIKLAKKKFPDIKIDKDNIKKEIIKFYKTEIPKDFLTSLDPKEIEKMSNEELYEKIEDDIKFNAIIIALESSLKFLNLNIKSRPELLSGMQKELPAYNEALYKTILMRETLKERLGAKAETVEKKEEKAKNFKPMSKEEVAKRRAERKRKRREKKQLKQLEEPKRKIEKAPVKEAKEKEKEKELIDEIIDSGGFNLVTTFEKGFEVKRDSKVSKRLSMQIPLVYENLSLDLIIPEHYSLIKLQRQITKQQPRVIKKLFGLKKEEVMETVSTGEYEDIMHNELVRGGKQEKCYEVFYNIGLGESARQYQCFDGRPGNLLSIKMLLPEKIALSLDKKVKTDPSILRKLAEQIAITKFNVSQEEWNKGIKTRHGHPLKPPFEKWQELNKGKNKIYIENLNFDESSLYQGHPEYEKRLLENVVEY